MKQTQTPIVFGNARFTVYTDGCIRLEYAGHAQFAETPSVLTGKNTPEPVTVDLRIQKKKLTLKTKKMTMEYTDDGNVFSVDNLKIKHKNYYGQDEVWVLGKEDSGNLGTVVRSLDFWKWCGGPERHPVQGILSTQGGHFLQDHPRVYWNKKAGWPQCLAHQVAFDGYYFAYGSAFKEALKDFVHVFGTIPMLPRWALGFWYSRWHDYSDKEILQLVRKYRREKIPIDVMVIDTDWRSGWGGYDWNQKQFPAPATLMERLHTLGVHVGLNDHPGYDNYDALPDHDSHIPEIERRLGPYPHQGQWACDWSNKQAVKTWDDVILSPFFKQGLDFWWIDGWLKSPFSCVDSQLWANECYYNMTQEKTNRRALILSRWGGIGSHRYPVQFSGDTASDWSTLKHQIEFTASSAGLGAVYWSHDIGGFFDKTPDEELYIRWAQFGSLSPIFRTHSDHGIREPWHFSDKALQAFRKQSQMRAALAPYLYNLSREAYEDGLPIIRPLYLEYTDNDGGALYRKHQYMIGKDLLVIPADGAVDKQTGTYPKRAYFPNGTWYGLETDECLRGLDDRGIQIPVDRIPVYIRGGAIIPAQVPSNNIGTAAPTVLHLDFYPQEGEKSLCECYEDDGASLDYQKKGFSRRRIEGVKTPEEILWKIHPPKGRYAGQPTETTLLLNTLIQPDETILSVETKCGRETWKPVKSTITTKALADSIETKRRFCRVKISLKKQVTQLKIKLLLALLLLFAWVPVHGQSEEAVPAMTTQETPYFIPDDLEQPAGLLPAGIMISITSLSWSTEHMSILFSGSTGESISALVKKSDIDPSFYATPEPIIEDTPTPVSPTPTPVPTATPFPESAKKLILTARTPAYAPPYPRRIFGHFPAGAEIILLSNGPASTKHVLYITKQNKTIRALCRNSDLKQPSPTPTPSPRKMPVYSGRKVDLTLWLDGYEGWKKALSIQRKTKKKLLLYFFTTWSEDSRLLSKELLLTGAFKNATKEIIKVKINPELNRQEARLAKKYQISTMPTVLVIEKAGADPMKIKLIHKMFGKIKVFDVEKALKAINAPPPAPKPPKPEKEKKVPSHWKKK